MVGGIFVHESVGWDSPLSSSVGVDEPAGC